MFIDETSLTTRKIARTFSRRRRLSTIGAKVSEVELDRGPIMSMSALGQKRTCARAIRDVRFNPNSDRESRHVPGNRLCLLWYVTHSFTTSG